MSTAKTAKIRRERTASSPRHSSLLLLNLLALPAAIVLALDSAGPFPPAALLAEPMALTPLLLITAALLGLPLAFKRLGGRAFPAFAYWVIAFLLGVFLGDRLLLARFTLNRDRYEALATRVFAGEAPANELSEKSDLAYAVHLIHARPPRAADTTNPAVGVAFIVVTHGFAGHVAFLRLFDREAERQLLAGGLTSSGWQGSRRLQDGWFLVGDRHLPH